MALTKDKLVICLQAQMGMTKQESLQIVARVLEIMKETLARGEVLPYQRFRKVFCQSKE